MGDKEFYSTKEAAEYLCLSESTVRRHIYETKRLKPEKWGSMLIFRQAQLDEFLANPPKPGRPPKDEPSD